MSQDGVHEGDVLPPVRPLRRSQRLMNKYGAQRTAKLGADGATSTDMDIDEATGPPHNRPRKLRNPKAVIGRKKASEAVSGHTGYFDWLPIEVTQLVLDCCTAQQLAALETTCRYFRESMIIEQTAELKLKAIPRSRGLVPNRK
jgi:hypothetical protein